MLVWCWSRLWKCEHAVHQQNLASKVVSASIVLLMKLLMTKEALLVTLHNQSLAFQQDRHSAKPSKHHSAHICNLFQRILGSIGYPLTLFQRIL